MSESTRIIFLGHIDDIRDDICGESKTIQARRMILCQTATFLGVFLMDSNLEMYQLCQFSMLESTWIFLDNIDNNTAEHLFGESSQKFRQEKRYHFQ